MSVAEGQAPDDVLLRYLIGPIADEEAERLDEMSIADDEFAWRLRAVEEDLVDAYARGDLSGDQLDRFKARYLSSPSGREKVRFAETLLSSQRRGAAKSIESVAPRRMRSISQNIGRWGLAAAALLVLAAGYLFVENIRLRNQVRDVQLARAALTEREQQLQRELNGQRDTNAQTVAELSRVQEALAELEARAGSSRPARTVLAFTLLPARRGAETLPTITVPEGADAIALRLNLEADDFPRYAVAIADPATDRIVWRADNLQSSRGDKGRVLSVTVPAALLKAQIYSIEVTGIPARGAGELAGTYSVRVART